MYGWEWQPPTIIYYFLKGKNYSIVNILGFQMEGSSSRLVIDVPIAMKKELHNFN